MQCKNCNATLPDGAVFCAACGHKQEPQVEAAAICPQCGGQLQPGAAFCPTCGARMEAAPAPAAPAAPAIADKVKKSVKKIQIPKKAIFAGLGAIAAVLVIVLVISLFSGGSKTGIFYVKDGQMQYLPSIGKEEAMEITEKLTGSDKLEGYELYRAVTESISGRVQLSADGKKLFYPDKYSDGSYTLYCRDLSKPKKEPIKIDSGLSSYYQINDEGTLVTYLKDGKLYQHDLKEKTKIDNDVTSYQVSDDGTSILYEVKEGKGSSAPAEAPAATEAPAAPADTEAPAEKKEKKRSYDGFELYLKSGKEDAVKVDEDIYDYYATDDLSTIYYLIQYDLYLVKDGKDPQKIASDVREIESISAAGCYYSVQEEEEIDLWAQIEDDMNNEESAYIKEYMEGYTMKNPVFELYFHDGKEATLVEKQVRSIRASYYDASFIAYSALTGEELPTIKLSEQLAAETDLFEEAMEEQTITYVAQGTKTAELPLEEIFRIYVGEKAETLWVMTEHDTDSREAVLHEVKLSDGAVKSVEEVDDDVYSGAFMISGSNYVYWKDVKGYEGELYLNGKEVGDDVPTGSCSLDKDSGKLYFTTDRSTKNNEYTLVCWNGKKLITVDEDVSRHTVLAEDFIVYLKDFSTSKYEGDMYVWTGKDPVKLDEDVVFVLPVRKK